MADFLRLTARPLTDPQTLIVTHPAVIKHILLLLQSNIWPLSFHCFWSLTTPNGNIWLYSCQKLHYVCQLAANSVYLLFGAEQVAHCGFFRAFSQKKKAGRCSQKNKAMRALREWIMKLWCGRLSNELKLNKTCIKRGELQIREIIHCRFITIRNPVQIVFALSDCLHYWWNRKYTIRTSPIRG